MKHYVLPWRADAQYDPKDAVKTYRSVHAAQRFASKENMKLGTAFVVRPENYVWDRSQK